MLRHLRFTLLSLLMLVSAAALAQRLTGVVTDAKTKEPLSFAYVRLANGKGTQADEEGRFNVPFVPGKARFSLVGYETKHVTVKQAGTLNVELTPLENVFGEAVVKAKKTKYSRKNNPAVELMKKVIAAKKSNDLHDHDYFSIDKYTKTTFAFNEVTEKIFQDGKFKRFPFLKDHVEICNETGKLILPVSVDESITRQIFRREPRSEKSIVIGERTKGINELINTGEILNTMLKDCFTDVNIYKDEVRLLQYPFISPISTQSGISFYRYFIVDTLDIDTTRCIRVDFTPNNSQDFGFSGSLFVIADSTYRILRADLGIPYRSDVNFVERMRILQDFAPLPTGEQVLIKDDMIVQLKVANFLNKFHVRRTTEYRDFSFEEIPDKTFRFKGDTRLDPNAKMRTEEFWQEHRADTLSFGEKRMGAFLEKLQKVKGFKPVLFVAKAFIENFVETSVDPKKPSKVDIGPVNTMITHNAVDGLRLRASAQTTANLNPHLFLRSYIAYGFKDNKWKGLGEVTYSFNKKAYLPREYPVNNLTFTYNRDVMAPTDRFMPTDKDNVFVSFKWTKVEHMMYYEHFKLLWDYEIENGWRFKLQAATEKDEPTQQMFYQPLDGTPATPDATRHYSYLRTADFKVDISFQPGVTWINTKQRRIPANRDAPIYSLSHTAGLYSFGRAAYAYNLTEASIYKRFWLRSWGKIDTYLKGGVQWNKVPYPMLIMPPANLSYIKEDNMFELINNMEFLNDRYASLMLSWDMNGKIFNRIPLLKKLKWREYIACNVLWGTLTKKNNPFLERNATDGRLLHFPGHFNADGSYTYTSHAMDYKKPYVEVIAGIHNIFKIFHIEYVRRLTYTDTPGVDKWGIRGMFRITF